MAHIIEDTDIEMELENSVASEHSENIDENDDILETLKEAMKMLPAKELSKIIVFGVNLLASMEKGEHKAARLPSGAQLKARAWEQWVLNRCNREGWAPFKHESKTGKVTEYESAGLSEDGKVVFCDTGKAFTNKHAKIYASLVRETEWYTEFESEYVPSEAPVAKPKMTEEEKKRKAEEAAAAKEAKEAEKQRKAAEKEQKAVEKERKAAEKQAEKERKLEEERQKRIAEEAKKKAGLAIVKALVPSVVPVVKAAKAAAPAAPAAPAPKPIISVKVAAPVKKTVWIKPANGELGVFEIGGKSFWRDAEDYLFENHNGVVGDFAGQFINGKIDDTVVNPFM